MAVAATRRGASLYEKLAYQWKRGWNEIPEVMAGTGLLIGGAAYTGYRSYLMYNTENRTKQFKHTYTIMRPDDPDTKWLRRNDHSPPITRTKMPNTKFC